MKKIIFLIVFIPFFNVFAIENIQNSIAFYGAKKSQSCQQIQQFFISNHIKYHFFDLDTIENQKKLAFFFHQKYPKKVLISVPALLIKGMMLFNPNNTDLLAIRKIMVENQFEESSKKCFPILFSLNRYEVLWNQNFNILPYSKEDLKTQEERIQHIFPKLRSKINTKSSVFQKWEAIINYLKIYSPSLKNYLILKLYLKSSQLNYCQE